MTFLHNLSVNALSTGLVFALGLVNQVLLANYLGDVGYGRLALWTNVALIAALVFGEWIRRGSTYVVGREQAAGAARDNALLYVLLLGAITALAAWFFRVALTGVLGEEVLVYWPFLALLTTCIVWQRSGQAILLGLDQVRSYALVPIVFIVVYMGGNALLWLLGSLQLATALNAFALAAALAALCAFILLWKHAGPFSWGDGQVLKRTLGEAAVGTYRVAVNFADMMQRLPDVAGAVLLAKVVRSEDSGRLSLRVARGVLFFSLAAALFLLLVGPWVIGLLFPAYTAAYAPMAWMLPGLIFLGFGSVFNTKLAGLGYPPATQWAPALAFVLNLLLNVYLIPRLGLEGAALSTSISYALWATCISWAYMRAEKLRWCDIIGRLPN